MASVSYRKVGSRWHIRFRAKGKKEVTKSLPGTLYEKTVAAKAGWYENEMALGRYDPWKPEPSSSLSVCDVLDEYLAVNLESGNWAPDSTHKTNKSVLTRMLEPVEARPITSLTPEEYQHLFEKLPGGAYTKKGDRGRINGFLKFAYNHGYIKDQIKVSLPMEYVLEMRNTDSIKYITWHQLDRVCKAHEFLSRQNTALFKTRGKPPEFYTNIFWFYFYSLLRKEELPKLKVKDLKGNKLSVKGKGRRTDIITLPPPALSIAKEFAKGKSGDDHLFVKHSNRPEHHLKNAVDMALGNEAPSKGFHMLRHSGVVYYISEGVPIQFISKLARHRSIKITLDVYADVLPDKAEEAFSGITHAPD
jgi:integrase